MSRRARAVLIIASVLAVLLPMSQLLRPGLAPRINDWENSLWAAGYTGRYLIARHALPGVFNTDKFVGHPAPVFYGPLLFASLGAASDVLGIGTAVRGAAVGVWALQFLLVFWLVRGVTASRWRAVAAAAMVCWAIYPLTNLYNRGALAEFFGTTLLFCAACAGGLAVLETDRRRRAAFALLCGLCGAAAAASHAITAVVGGITLLCLAPPALQLGAPATKQTLRRRYAVTAGLGLAAALVVSPWLYATLQFSGHVRVASEGRSLGYIPEYDAWYVRLSPIPLPTPASGILSVKIPATPYLDPQINSAMLVLLLWTLFTLWRAKASVEQERSTVRPIEGPKTVAASYPLPVGSRSDKSTASSRHPERCEGSLLSRKEEILRCAQDDKHLRACARRLSCFVGEPKIHGDSRGGLGRLRQAFSRSKPAPLASPGVAREGDRPDIDFAARQMPPASGASQLLRASVILFLAAFLLSVVPEIGWHLPAAVGGLIQFAYRLVTYQNLAIFVALVAALIVRERVAALSGRMRRADAAAWVAALALSGAGLTVKLAHAARTLGPARAEALWAADPSQLAKAPDTYYGQRDYAVVDESRMLYKEPLEQLRNVTVVVLPLGERFGDTGAVRLDAPADCWVKTDVVAFPWNRLVLDGRVLPPVQTRETPNYLAARVLAGRHTLGYEFDPPTAWMILREVSFTVAIVWSLVVMMLFVSFRGPTRLVGARAVGPREKERSTPRKRGR